MCVKRGRVERKRERLEGSVWTGEIPGVNILFLKFDIAMRN